MPKIAELRDIEGEVWCRVGKPGEFANGIALWPPQEQEAKYREGYRDGYDDAAARKPRQP